MDAPPHSPGNVSVHGTVRRRNSDQVMGGEQDGTFSEPPIKRIRAESEATTVITPSTSQAATREAATHCPSDSATPIAKSSWVTHRIQRSSSDMVLSSENEASPPRPDEKVVDKKTDQDNGLPSLKLQTSTLAAESHEKKMTEETMPPIQDLSLLSPKPNPFTACRISFHHPGALLPFLTLTIIPDFGRLSCHPPVVGHTRSRSPTAGPQLPEIQKQYMFSAAEIHTLVASRGSDEESSSNKLVFYLDWTVMKGISKWRNFTAGQG